jgi:hypothetical protein
MTGTMYRVAIFTASTELALYAKLALNSSQPFAVLRLQRLGLIGELGEVAGVQVLRRGLGELGLPLQFLARKHKIRQRQIRLDAPQCRVEGGARYTHRLRLRP